MELYEAIAKLGPWHHDVELAPGVSTLRPRGTPGGSDGPLWQRYSPEKQMGRLFDTLFEDGQLQGRSFLDCACNSGAHTVAAARAGAGRCFAFDARDLWVEQGRFLARHFGLHNMQVEKLKLSDLPALRLDPFDVTLFGGIFYHLPDPVAGLKIAADLTRELLILNTSVLPRRSMAMVLSMESETDVLSGVDRLAWLPTNPEVLRRILAWCGFPHSRVDWYRPDGKPKNWKRVQIVAAREPAALAVYDRRRPDTLRYDKPGLVRRAMRRLRP